MNLETEKRRRYEIMREIKEEIVNLKESPFYETRVRPVIGEGSHMAEVVFIGEAPGKNESETGRPFCGAAGKVLDQLLDLIGLPRTDVYITNIVKDRPPNNRDPLPAEIELYAPFLDKQIAVIKPKVIATLGRFAMNYIMNRYGLEFEIEPISRAHGKKFETDFAYGKVIVVPLYHPAVALYNRTTFEILQSDFKILREIIQKTAQV